MSKDVDNFEEIDESGAYEFTVPAPQLFETLTELVAPSLYTPSYGRKFYPNPLSEYYPMEARLAPWGKPKTTIWPVGELLNQGSEGACVGHAMKGLLLAEPNVHTGEPDAFTIYYEAQKRDPWKDKEHSGTTVKAAAEYLHEIGLIEQYVWARSGHEIVRWISEHGPVVLGTLWFESMNEPNDLGFVKIVGEPVGGHSFLAYGFIEELDAVLCRNSWGPYFGINGDFYIKFSDLDVLLRSYGEACAATEKAV
jgi:hypothetical protein